MRNRNHTPRSQNAQTYTLSVQPGDRVYVMIHPFTGERLFAKPSLDVEKVENGWEFTFSLKFGEIS